MKIASWNVNSLRVRLPQVLSWLQETNVDILGIQETKVEDDSFPINEIKEAGFFCEYIGQKTYNGVTTISKIPPDESVKLINGKEQDQKRFLVTRYGNDLTVLNLYVVNGHEVGSDKYDYKLAWLRDVMNFIKKDMKKTKYYLILGDFNIAPSDEDIYDPAAWEGKILCSEKERASLKNILNLGFKDSFRLFDQEKELYSWWDYRTGAFRRNRGLRIDLILTNESLSKKCSSSYIDLAPRKNERPSDHAPVVSVFDL
jgi:exodeoxyribonuclease-3